MVVQTNVCHLFWKYIVYFTGLTAQQILSKKILHLWRDCRKPKIIASPRTGNLFAIVSKKKCNYWVSVQQVNVFLGEMKVRLSSRLAIDFPLPGNYFLEIVLHQFPSMLSDLVDDEQVGGLLLPVWDFHLRLCHIVLAVRSIKTDLHISLNRLCF